MLAENRSPAVLPYLQKAYVDGREPAFRQAVVAAMASMRIAEATGWLLERLGRGERDARNVAEALWDAEPSEETVAELVRLGFQRGML